MILGIAGPAGAGKDTVADYLVAQHGFVKLAFAGPLKEMLAVAGFAEPAERALKEALVPGFDFSWRRAAQALGTEWGRVLDPAIWTKIIARRIDILSEQRRHVVLSDVRFANEASLIRGLGGSILHLYGRRVDLGEAAAHVSENGVQYWPSKDHLINNAGSLVELHEQLELALAAERQDLETAEEP